MGGFDLKKVVFVTGTRADFGKISPLARVCEEKNHRIFFFVTGMHMLEQYGLTKEEVRDFSCGEVYEFVNQLPNDELSSILQKTISGLGDFVDLVDPDIVFYHGDRVEALAAALVCCTKKVHGSHIEGGELSGTIDEIFRHATTKLSTSHFVSSDRAKELIGRMGEKHNTIFHIGSPELDEHNKDSDVSFLSVKSRYDITFNDYGIISLHPVFYESELMGSITKKVFSELDGLKKNFVVILPNNDPGSLEIQSVIEEYKGCKNFRILPNLRFEYFSILMKNAKLIVGNSSIVVREAPFIGIPSINIGTRQNNRSTAPSIIHIDNDHLDGLGKIALNHWGCSVLRDQSFGDGRACQRFGEVISDRTFWDIPVSKQFFWDTKC